MKKIIIILFLILVVAGISGCVNSEDGKQTEMNVVVSGAMEPVLYRGDIVIVKKNPDDIQVGDIVVYNATWFSQPVIHRDISIKNNSNGNAVYEIKGDNNPVPDPELVSKNQISSKVVNTDNSPYVIPKLGYISLWIRGI